jgi:hypothetical protein
MCSSAANAFGSNTASSRASAMIILAAREASTAAPRWMMIGKRSTSFRTACCRTPRSAR